MTNKKIFELNSNYSCKENSIIKNAKFQDNNIMEIANDMESKGEEIKKKLLIQNNKNVIDFKKISKK